MDVNKVSEAEMVKHLITFYTNQNYRANYNRSKSAIIKAMANDPIVANRIAELKKTVKK